MSSSDASFRASDVDVIISIDPIKHFREVLSDLQSF